MNAREYQNQHPGATIFQLPVAFVDSAGEVVASIEEGGAESRNGHRVATIYLPLGDFLGFRNAQSGEKTDKPGSLNFDYGAGSAEFRGIVSRNIDIGRGANHFDGRGNLIYRERGYDDKAKNFAEFHSDLRIHKLFVPKAFDPAGNATQWRRVSL